MNVGVYARQSIEKKDSVSIEAQIEKCVQYCNYKGWNYKIYKDSGYSGKDINRPDFQRMAEDLKQEKLNAIITYRLDRISRNITDFSLLLKQFEQHKADFISVTENFDTSTPMGRAMVMIIMVFAQLERETITERIKDNCYFRAKLGRWTGGIVPLGYSTTKIIESNKEKTVLVISQEEANIVKQIFDLYLENKSIRKVVTELNNKGIKTKNKSNWTQQVASSVIRNVLYATNTVDIYNHFQNTGINIVNEINEYTGQKGCMFYGRVKGSGSNVEKQDISKHYLIIGEHQGIILGSEWVKAQILMAKNKSLPPRTGKGTSILTGLIKCGKCGYSMHVAHSYMYSLKRAQKYSATNITYRYLKCGRKINQGDITCDNTSSRADEIETIVLKKLKKRLKTKKTIMPNMVPKELEIQHENKQNIQNKIKKIDKSIDNLIQNLTKSTSAMLITKIEQKIEQLEIERNNLYNELEKIQLEISIANNSKVNTEYIAKMANDFDFIFNNATNEERKDILKTLIKQITIINKTIEIEYFF